MTSNQIIENEPAYLIHQRPFSESSQIINLFSRHFGRVDLIAKGSKRPKSKFKSFLQPFMPILVSWSGRSQLKTLRSIDLNTQRKTTLPNKQLMSAFYLNELILSLLITMDPYPDLFDCYALTIDKLSDVDFSESVLRTFEIKLLSQIGYAINFQTEGMSSNYIDAEQVYRFVVEEGFVRSHSTTPHDSLIKGSIIKAIDRGDYSTPQVLKAAKRITRKSIKYHLSGKELNTKKVFKSIHKSS
tara:strand:+ start:1629 stop:2357 length:729 start_codon:yes stop_codon:yes gene_type:complete